MQALELRIIDLCNRKIFNYIRQDVKCKKCGHIKRDTLSTYCSCSGEWVNKEMEGKELRALLSIVKTKAVFHGLKWLQETLEQYGIY